MGGRWHESYCADSDELERGFWSWRGDSGLTEFPGALRDQVGIEKAHNDVSQLKKVVRLALKITCFSEHPHTPIFSFQNTFIF